MTQAKEVRLCRVAIVVDDTLAGCPHPVERAHRCVEHLAQWLGKSVDEVLADSRRLERPGLRLVKL